MNKTRQVYKFIRDMQILDVCFARVYSPQKVCEVVLRMVARTSRGAIAVKKMLNSSFLVDHSSSPSRDGLCTCRLGVVRSIEALLEILRRVLGIFFLHPRIFLSRREAYVVRLERSVLGSHGLYRVESG